ncbi:MAG: DinB family protein [Egibacteraceae bacterium]
MPGFVPPVADEREGLLGYLAQQRDVLRIAAYGLADDQARATPTASALSVGGLIKHCAYVERGWIDQVLRRPGNRSVEEDESDLRLDPDETLASALARYDEEARHTKAVVGGIADLGQAVPVPRDIPWFPKDIEAWSVRWVLLHLIEETARHAGHADIIRESIDGASALSLMAAAEGWPADELLKPWEAPA